MSRVPTNDFIQRNLNGNVTTSLSLTLIVLNFFKKNYIWIYLHFYQFSNLMVQVIEILPPMGSLILNINKISADDLATQGSCRCIDLVITE